MKGPDLVSNLDARYVLGAVSLGEDSLNTARKFGPTGLPIKNFQMIRISCLFLILHEVHPRIGSHWSVQRKWWRIILRSTPSDAWGPY